MTKPKVPTVREFVPLVAGATKPSTRALYAPYWKRLVDGFVDPPDPKNPKAKPKRGEHALGDRRLDRVTTLDIEKGKNLAVERAVTRRSSHAGQSAGEHYVGAARRLFQKAVDEKLITANPASKVDKPKRPRSNRSALPAELVPKLWDVVVNGGNDPVLDLILVRFHLETGARRGGAIALRRSDLDAARQTVWLSEKNGMRREQPVTRKLFDRLIFLMNERTSSRHPSDPVFHYSNGSPLTRRRYNTLFERIQRDLPEAGRISAHVLRHTAITWVERTSGSYNLAGYFAGHYYGPDVTSTYIRVDIADVAKATSEIWRERHPLAPAVPRRQKVTVDSFLEL
jgi:integrase/recombinase XerC